MISDFQMALAGIAVVVIVAVIVYNRWQESTYKKRVERAFTTDHPDVLFGGPPDRVEPQWGDVPRPRMNDDVEEGLLSPIVSEPIVPRSTGQPGAVNADIDSVARAYPDRVTATLTNTVYNFIVGKDCSQSFTPVNLSIGRIGQPVIHKNVKLFFFTKIIPIFPAKFRGAITVIDDIPF